MFEFPLKGPSGEPVDLWRTLMSHGVADLPPMRVDEDERTLTATLAFPTGKPRTVVIREGDGQGLVEVLGPKLGARAEEGLRAVLRRVLNLDEDLSGFYAVAAEDPDLAWAAHGAGRMLRSPSVFEEVIKTRCPLIITSHGVFQPAGHASAVVTGCRQIAWKRGPAGPGPTLRLVSRWPKEPSSADSRDGLACGRG